MQAGTYKLANVPASVFSNKLSSVWSHYYITIWMCAYRYVEWSKLLSCRPMLKLETVVTLPTVLPMSCHSIQYNMIWCFSCNIAMQERNPVICLAEPVLPTATSSTCLVSYLPVPSSRQAGIRKFFCWFQAGVITARLHRTMVDPLLILELELEASQNPLDAAGVISLAGQCKQRGERFG